MLLRWLRQHWPLARTHPYTKNRIISFIARHGWPFLLGLFVVLVIALAAALAAFDRLSHPDQIPASTIYLVAYLLGAETLLPPPLLPVETPISVVLAGFLRILLQGLFLGTIVFKLLVPQELYTFRPRLIICRDENGAWQAIIRLYNSTRLEVIDLEFGAFLRTPVMKDVRRVDISRTTKLMEALAPFVKNSKITLDAAKKDWPISIPYIPYSLPIPLHDGDVCYDRGRPVLRSIQGCTVTPSGIDGYHGNSFLAVILRGHIPSLATDLVETHWFTLAGKGVNEPGYEFGNFHDVYVVPGSLPKRAGGDPHAWTGWKEFENVRPVATRPGRQWIFGYGSLVDAEHLAQYLAGYGLALGNYGYCELAGFKRTWNVAMNNAETLPNYKYYVDPQTGRRPNVYVAFANIEALPDPEAKVAGILFEADERMLQVFDQRELNYWRTDVTKHLSGVDIDGTVWCYIGSPEANERFQQGVLTNSVVIDRDYLQRMQNAFAHAGLPFTAEVLPRVPIVNLKRIDT